MGVVAVPWTEPRVDGGGVLLMIAKITKHHKKSFFSSAAIFLHNITTRGIMIIIFFYVFFWCSEVAHFIVHKGSHHWRRLNNAGLHCPALDWTRPELPENTREEGNDWIPKILKSGLGVIRVHLIYANYSKI